MLSMLDLTVLSDSNPTNIIRSVLQNAADTFGGHSNKIKEPTSRGIKEPNIGGRKKTTHKRYKSYK